MKEVYVGFIVERNEKAYCYNCNYNLDGYLETKQEAIRKRIDNFPHGKWPEVEQGECPKCKDLFMEEDMWMFMGDKDGCDI